MSPKQISEKQDCFHFSDLPPDLLENLEREIKHSGFQILFPEMLGEYFNFGNMFSNGISIVYDNIHDKLVRRQTVNQERRTVFCQSKRSWFSFNGT
jgi:hypothetical protein